MNTLCDRSARFVFPLAVCAALGVGGVCAQDAPRAFYRVESETETVILALDNEGWLTWSNAAVGGTCVVQRTVSLAPAADWAGIASLSATTAVLRMHVWEADSMARIDGGPFAMGNGMAPEEGWEDELPVHTVSVASFRMDRREISGMLWNTVYAWATNHGYAFDGVPEARGPNHPVVGVSWHDCVKWCNARSEKENRTACYYTSADTDTVYRTDQIDLGVDSVRWDADGYRLPTEAEWEYAARGGAIGRRFPWADTNAISHAAANYFSYWEEGAPFYAYDVSPTEGYHPAYTNGVEPYTSPVGCFAANAFGLYDMAGNVWEWCWDWYAGDWYEAQGAVQADTRGPGSGSTRVVRGGAWIGDAFGARCSFRGAVLPGGTGNDRGFRCVRR